MNQLHWRLFVVLGNLWRLHPSRQKWNPIAHGVSSFENHGNGVDLVVDVGDELQGLDTTVIDLTGEDIEIIREGAGDISLLQ